MLNVCCGLLQSKMFVDLFSDSKCLLFGFESTKKFETMSVFKGVVVFTLGANAVRVSVESQIQTDVDRHNASFRAGVHGWQYGPSSGCDGVGALCGPNEWHLLPHCGSCPQVGTQSPIDIKTEALGAAPGNINLDLEFKDSKDLACDPLNYVAAKGAKITMPPQCKQSMMFEGKEYNLLQFHYHSPSEHTINGEHHPMEVHHVHKAADGEITVIAVFVTAGEPSDDDEGRSDWLEHVIGEAPDVDDGDDVDDDVASDEMERMKMMDPYSHFIPSFAETGYYYYKGSFTTPPCSTGVNWIIIPTVVTVDPEIIEAYRTHINAPPKGHHLAPYGLVVGDDEAEEEPEFAADDAVDEHMNWDISLGVNNRPIQATGGRATYHVHG